MITLDYYCQRRCLCNCKICKYSTESIQHINISSAIDKHWTSFWSPLGSIRELKQNSGAILNVFAFHVYLLLSKIAKTIHLKNVIVCSVENGHACNKVCRKTNNKKEMRQACSASYRAGGNEPIQKTLREIVLIDTSYWYY